MNFSKTIREVAREVELENIDEDYNIDSYIITFRMTDEEFERVISDSLKYRLPYSQMLRMKLWKKYKEWCNSK